MQFNEQSYSGKVLRPNPIIDISDNGELILILTCWGKVEAAELCIDVIKDYFLSSLDDHEATSPHPIYPQYSMPSNHLRIAVQLANERIFSQFNSDSYTAGIEIYAANLDQTQLNWISLGFPQSYIMKHKEWMPLDLKQDLSFDFQIGENKLAPLASEFLGQHSFHPLQPKSVKVEANDKLLLCSHNNPKLSNTENLEKIVNSIAKDSSSDAFWTGILEF